jgi:hypothetical protein
MSVELYNKNDLFAIKFTNNLPIFTSSIMSKYYAYVWQYN